MGTKTIQESLQSLFKELGYENKIKNFIVIDKWSEIVGEKIALKSEPQRITEKVLYVKVKSSSWRTELNMQKQLILKKIEEKFGKNLIIDIRFY